LSRDAFFPCEYSLSSFLCGKMALKLAFLFFGIKFQGGKNLSVSPSASYWLLYKYMDGTEIVVCMLYKSVIYEI
jgi:hypothetical protein